MQNATKKVHGHSNLNRKLYLWCKLSKMRLEREQDMHDHVNAMQETVEYLCGLRGEMKGNKIEGLFLCSLPESQCPLIDALVIKTEAELKLEWVQGKLLEECNLRKELQTDKDIEKPETALKVNEVIKHVTETRL